MLRDLILIVGLVVALRAPFLNQAIQGDDIYYLAGAQHAQIDPAHPHRATYLFQGRMVDMRGHPHPPLNSWILGGLLAVIGDVEEIPFHAAYALFSLLAALGMYALARLFIPELALVATCLFCAVPAFVVNGNSLESDLPFLAFWMVGLAAFWWAVQRASLPLLGLASFSLALAGVAAYQSVLAIPILWMLLIQRKSRWWIGYAAALAPALALFCYQLSEPTPPVATTLGYFQEYGLQVLQAKVLSAEALTGHLGWMVFPLLGLASFYQLWTLLALPFVLIDFHVLYVVGAVVAVSFLARSSARYAWWPHIFFAGALLLFFAGSARYLLPMAAPLVLAVVEKNKTKSRWLWGGFFAQLSLGLGLAWVNYQHWDGYRRFVADHAKTIGTNPTLVNGEWGLRFYAESLGAIPLAQGQSVKPGQLILTSELGYPIAHTLGGGQRVELARAEIVPTLPFRLIGLGSKSGYSTASTGVRPFDLMTGALDRIRLEKVIERKPTLSYVPMGASESEQHIVSGAYQIENGQYRWMGREAKLLLKNNGQQAVAAVVYIPDLAPARLIELEVNQKLVASQLFDKAGLYTIEAKGLTLPAGDVLLTVRCDKVFQAPGDTRELGVILREAGLR